MMEINFRLVGLQIMSIFLETAPEIPQEFKFVFELTIENKVQADRNIILVFVYVKIYNDDKTKILGKLDTVSFFEVLNFTDFVKQNENGIYDVSPDLDKIIRPIAISTTRGIVYSEFKGTYLHNALMPVVLMKDLEIKKKE